MTSGPPRLSMNVRRERGQGVRVGLRGHPEGTLIPNPFSLPARAIRQGEGAPERPARCPSRSTIYELLASLGSSAEMKLRGSHHERHEEESCLPHCRPPVRLPLGEPSLGYLCQRA